MDSQAVARAPGAVPPLEAKKLLQRRRDILNTYSFSAFQFQAAQNAVFLKNRNFLRQMRSGDFNNYIFVEETNNVTLYRHQKTNQQFVLKQTKDDYRFFQVEHFVNQLTCNDGYRYINRFLAPSAVFYTTTSTYQLVNVLQMQVRMVPIQKHLKDLADPKNLSKRTINQAFYVFDHLLSMLGLLHKLGLCLAGEFGQLYFVGEILKLDLVNLSIRVPETHAEGVKKDLLQLKVQLEAVFQVQFRRHLSAQHLAVMLQQVIQTIDDFVIQQPEKNGLSRGLTLNDASSLISRLPFFGQQRYMTFIDAKDEHAIPFRVELEQSQKASNKIAQIQQLRRIHIMKKLDDAIQTVQHNNFYMRPLSAGALRKIQTAKKEQQGLFEFPIEQTNQNSQQPHTLTGPKAAKRPVEQPVTLQRLKRTNSVSEEATLAVKAQNSESSRQMQRGFQGRRCRSGAVYNKREDQDLSYEASTAHHNKALGNKDPEKAGPGRPSSGALRQYDDVMTPARPPVETTAPMDVFDGEMEVVRQQLSRLQERSVQLTTSQLRASSIRERIAKYAEKCVEIDKTQQLALSGPENNSFRLATPQPGLHDFPHKQGLKQLGATLSGLKSTVRVDTSNNVAVHGKSIAKQPEKSQENQDHKEKRLHTNSREESKRSPGTSYQDNNQRSQSNVSMSINCKTVNVNKSSSLPVRGKTQRRHRILQEVPMQELGQIARAQVEINMRALNFGRK